MSKKARLKRSPAPSPRRIPWLWLVVAGAVLLVAGGLAILWTGSQATTGSPVTPQVTGAPRLAVDKTEVDEGYVKLETPVRSQFILTNVGDQSLQIVGEPQVQLVEGC
jgi:hypothetical protein